MVSTEYPVNIDHIDPLTKGRYALPSSPRTWRMSIVAEFIIPADAVPGGNTLKELPEATIELERIIPTSSAALPFFWMFGVDVETALDSLQNEPDLADVDVLAEVDTGVLFRATWTPEAPLIEGIKTLNATILNAIGTPGEWLFRVRARDRERLAAFQEIFTDQDIPVELRRIYNFAELVEGDRPVTPEQRETLVTAYREGYFDQPRQVSQTDLGGYFGISGRAVSNRLRRGTKNLVASTLLEPSDDEAL